MIVFVLTVFLIQSGHKFKESEQIGGLENFSKSDLKTHYLQNLLHNAKFKRLKEIASPSSEFINIGMTIINNKKEDSLESSFEWKLTRNIKSMLTFSSGDPLHWIILTDHHSLKTVASFLSDLLFKYASEGVIMRRSWRWKRLRGMPKITISFADCEEIVSLERSFFNAMKKNSQQGNSSTGSYTEDLFYIAPIYHKAFTNIDKIIFLDSKDLEFVSDIKLLHDQFKLMDKAMIGIGPDLTPHYYSFLKGYIDRNVNSSLGLPGKMQGFNTGVVLYNLDSMRKSALYNWYVTAEGVDYLMNKYGYKMFLAEQDWMSNLGFSHPTLFYNLPCNFNRQTSIDYLRPPWLDLFHQYHMCDKPTNIKIFHRNGCGPTPKCCGHIFPSKGSTLNDINIDMEEFWDIFANPNRFQNRTLPSILANTLIINCADKSREYCLNVINGIESITDN